MLGTLGSERVIAIYTVQRLLLTITYYMCRPSRD